MGVQGPWAPPAGIIDLIIARSSAEAGLELVERQVLDRVLAEQAVQAMADPTTVVRLGRIVGADVFLFVESADQGRNIRVRYVESRTGTVVLTAEEVVSDLSDSSTLLKRQWRLVREKLRVPAKDRRYVSILSFRSEEPLTTLHAWADAHLRLLESGLDTSPSISLVERAQIRHLAGEAELTSAEMAIQAASVAIEISVRRHTSETNRLTLIFSYPGGSPITTVLLDLPSEDTLRARHLLLDRVLDTIKAEPPSADAMLSSASEAKLFRLRAERLSGIAPSAIRQPWATFSLQIPQHYGHGWNDPEGARQAAEAAYALEPTPYHQFLAASLNLGSSRSIELFHRYWRTELAAHQAAGRTGALTNLFDLPLRVSASRSGAAGAPLLSEENILLQRETLSCILQIRAAQGDVKGWMDMLGLALRVCRAWCHSPEEWAAYAKIIITLARQPPVPPPPPAPGNRWTITVVDAEGPVMSFYRRAADCFLSDGAGYTPYLDKNTPDAVTRALGWMRDSEDNYLALCAYINDFQKNHWSPVLATQAMKRIGALSLSDPIRNEDSLLTRCVHYCVFRLENSTLSGDERRRLWEDIYQLLSPTIEAIVTAGDSRRLSQWLNYGVSARRQSAWLQVLVHQPADIAKAWVSRADALLGQKHDEVPMHHVYSRGRLASDRRLLEAITDAPALPTNNALSPHVSALVLEPLPNLQPYEGARGLIRAEITRGKLFCVWALPSPYRGRFNLRVTSGPIEGPLKPGPWVEKASPGIDKLKRSVFISGIAVTDSVIALGVGSDGLFIFDTDGGKRAKLVKEAPAGMLGALDACRGKIYCWYSDPDAPGGWLYRYDPKPPGRFELLASHRSMADDCTLNGGVPYEITSILGDETRGVLWLGIMNGAGRDGLWRFDPQQRQAEQVAPNASRSSIGQVSALHWHNEDILVKQDISAAVLFSPATTQFRTLRSSGTSRLPVGIACAVGTDIVSTTGLAGSSMSQQGGTDSWSHISKGELWFHRQDNGPPMQIATRPDGKIPNVSFMRPLGKQEVLLISRDMTFWRLRSTSDLQVGIETAMP